MLIFSCLYLCGKYLFPFITSGPTTRRSFLNPSAKTSNDPESVERELRLENIEKIELMIRENRRISTWGVADEVFISQERVNHIVRDILGFK